MDEATCQWIGPRIGCGLTESRHHMARHGGPFVAPARKPEPHEIVAALVVTEWRCRACGADNDVWGEGAINGWMECSCGEASWLSLDAGIAEALGESA